MIPLAEFEAAVKDVLDVKLNPPQQQCVKHSPKVPLMIVAGPGSGKTTVLVLRALRHALVDGMAADSLLITTFTRKAAGELASRLVTWGLKIVEHFEAVARTANDRARLAWLERLDITSIRTGTLDSFCQEWLGATRQPGSPAPVMLEQFAANFVYRRRIFAGVFHQSKAVLAPYLGLFSFDGRPPASQTDAAHLSTVINNRLVQDLVDLPTYRSSGPACAMQADLLTAYRNHLQSRQMFDFALCAERIHQGLKAGTLYPDLPPIAALLVDEYQDTNPLQEAIYFALAAQSGASFTVVGDDDQALYRFRGATVELFTNFPTRLALALPGSGCRIEYLVTNHRSTPSIVSFFNTLAAHDPAFKSARVANKPQIAPFNQENGIPVLGMFRDDIDILGNDLSRLLLDVFHGSGYLIQGTGTTLKGGVGGALGDAVLLSSTAREFKDGRTGPVECLPMKLRRGLQAQNQGVFNPRGQDLRDLRNVQILLGLVLLCLDPTDQIETNLPLTREAQTFLPLWRNRALAFVQSNPPPFSKTGSLQKYVEGWRLRRPSEGKWPQEIPLLDLLYKLIVWMPPFQNDPEHQIYLEAIMRCVTQGAHYSRYSFRILDQGDHYIRSRESVVRDLLAPVAERAVDVDEDLLFAIPNGRLSVMTIHQSKGLEYPLVIVDVGSEFNTAHHFQAFKRYPKAPSSTVDLETALAPYTEVGGVRTARTSLDRTFDDLVRLYYVAYSRAQGALLLVGLNPSLRYATNIMNIATFWSRNANWNWRQDNPPLARRTPTMADRLPLTLI